MNQMLASIAIEEARNNYHGNNSMGMGNYRNHSAVTEKPLFEGIKGFIRF